MPRISEIRSGIEIGKNNRALYIWWSCEDCGYERWVITNHGKPQSKVCKDCRTKRLIERNIANRGQRCQNWRGGRTTDTKGYALVKIYPNDFFFPMAHKNWYVKEHRLVMAKLLGRCLMDFEEVHHKNGVKDDNRPENLRLVIHTDHSDKIRCPHCLKSFEVK